ncbi:hypothetical protein [Amycolatopsis sp. NPDC003676]
MSREIPAPERKRATAATRLFAASAPADRAEWHPAVAAHPAS